MNVPLPDALMFVNSRYFLCTYRFSRTSRQDIYDIHVDFARMYVYPNDIWYANIISAPPAPPGLAGLKCPFHDRVHDWRIIDLEHVVETNVKPEHHAQWCAGWLRRALDYLPEGFYMDPEQF